MKKDKKKMGFKLKLTSGMILDGEREPKVPATSLKECRVNLEA